MPKAVDIYVLEKKIGSGQFGDVFKGYSKVDGTDVAIKTIRRDKIKGKFTQLLENQIQVLKSCKNNNIIQLIDIKKTTNNIYLILQYCNEGDLGAYIKLKKKIHEDEAIQYLVQILHAFQTLVKNKIMHRDFKLPNVLKNDGVIKIADFGFAKLLGSQDEQAQTILGSPLNMAPEVLNHQAYNSKADIWSIGVAFFQLLFGKVPFSASNIVDLVKKIHNQPLVFPWKIPNVFEDVIRKMLVVDPNKRIQWNQLFHHPIVRYREQKLQSELQKSLICHAAQLSFNLSKFYIKSNMVIENTHQILEKAQINNYIKSAMKNQKYQQYKGITIKRQTQRKKQSTKQLTLITNKQINDQQDFTELYINQKDINDKLMKSNQLKLLHQRNTYAFLGHLSEQLLELNKNIYAECMAFLILKKIISIIQKLNKQLQTKKYQGIYKWELFQQTKQYQAINNLIASEKQIFMKFYQKLSMKVLNKGTLEEFEEDLMISGKFTLEQTNKKIYERVLKQYLKRINQGKSKITINDWSHISKLLDSLQIHNIFVQDFDFKNYYQYFNGENQGEIIQNCRKKYNKFLKNK